MICVIVFNAMIYHNVLLKYCRLNDIITGNSVVATILLLFCSVIFKYGVWHRLIVVSNFIIILIIFNRSYFYWCLDNVDELTVSDNVILEIKKYYPHIILPKDISSKIRN